MSTIDDYIIVSGNNPTKLTVVLPDARKLSVDGVQETDNDLLGRIAAQMDGIVIARNNSKFWPDRKYRDVWRFDKKKKKINIDVNSLKNARLEKYRQKRNMKLGELDILAMRALEEGRTEDLSRIVTEKQTLRDLLPIVEAKLNAALNSKKSEKAKLRALESFTFPELEV